MEVTTKKLGMNVVGQGPGVGAGAGSGHPGGDGPSSAAAHTTSSGREVILSWKIRSQQMKQPSAVSSSHLSSDKISPPGKENKNLPDPADENALDEHPTGEMVGGKKPRRSRKPWEIWSEAAKDTFFDALNEHGKDFAAIQNHFAAKVKKKSLPAIMMKNKEQVRHFYYRTWHKISKHFPMGDDVKKGTLELYALINYGELRRKIGNSLDDDKNAAKLRELVQLGMTRVRVRGKTLRIKTPVCRALKKINDIDVEAAERMKKLPETVYIELRPRNSEAFAKVQSLAQNPRIKVNISIQRRLSSLIRMLERKWRPLNVKKRLDLMNSEAEAFPLLEDNPSKPEYAVRLFPKPGVPLSVIKMSTMEQTNKIQPACLSLNSHRERWKAAQADKPEKGRGKLGKHLNGDNKVPDVGKQELQEDNFAGADVATDDDEYYDADADDDGDTTQSEEIASNSDDGEHDSRGDGLDDGKAGGLTLSINAAENYTFETELCSPGARRQSTSSASGQPPDETVRRRRYSSKISEDEEEALLAREESTETTSSGSVKSFFGLIKLGVQAESNITEFLARHKGDGDENDGELVGEAKLSEEDLSACEKVKAFTDSGWVRATARQLTVGELFLMFGRPSRICLEYEFVKPKSDNSFDKEGSSVESVCDRTLPTSHPRRLLKRLVDFASFSLQKSKAIRESHRCGGSLVPLPYSKSLSTSASNTAPTVAHATVTIGPVPGAKKRGKFDASDNPIGPTAIVSASLTSGDDFLFRVPLTAQPAPNQPNASNERHTSIVVPPSAPQIKKLKAGERAVRRIVPVVTATDPGGGVSFVGPSSQPNRQVAHAHVQPSRRGSKRFVFHQSVATTRGGSVVVKRAEGQQRMSPADERMNEALKRLIPEGSAAVAPNVDQEGEEVLSVSGGTIQTSFPVNYGMRKVVQDSLESVRKQGAISSVHMKENDGRRTPPPLPDNAAPPASPSALSLLMDISFPDSEMAMASQIIASQRSSSPTPSDASETRFSTFSGLFRSLADSFNDPNLAQAGVASSSSQAEQHSINPALVVTGHPQSHNKHRDQLPSTLAEQSPSFVVTRVQSLNQFEHGGIAMDGGTPTVVILSEGDVIPSNSDPVVLTNMCAARTPPLSPSHVLLESDNQWLTSEVMDLSLGSFLGHLESPIKSSAVTVAGDFQSPSTSNGP